MTSDAPAWYVAAEGQQPSGPFTIEQMLEARRTGRLDPAALCWREGMPDWLPVARVEPFAAPARFPQAAAPAPARPASNRGGSNRRKRARTGLPVFWVAGLSLAAIALFVGFALVRYSRSTPSGSSITPSASADAIPIVVGDSSALDDGNRRSRATGIDREAGIVAINMWKPAMHAGSYYLKRKRTDPSGGAGVRGGTLVDLFSGEWLHELRDPFVLVSPRPLNEADRLNGLHWQGTVTLCAGAERTTDLRRGGGWGNWSSGPRLSWLNDEAIVLEQRGGNWDAHIQALDNYKYSKVFIEFSEPDPGQINMPTGGIGVGAKSGSTIPTAIVTKKGVNPYAVVPRDVAIDPPTRSKAGPAPGAPALDESKNTAEPLKNGVLIDNGLSVALGNIQRVHEKATAFNIHGIQACAQVTIAFRVVRTGWKIPDFELALIDDRGNEYKSGGLRIGHGVGGTLFAFWGGANVVRGALPRLDQLPVGFTWTTKVNIPMPAAAPMHRAALTVVVLRVRSRGSIIGTVHEQKDETYNVPIALPKPGENHEPAFDFKIPSSLLLLPGTELREGKDLVAGVGRVRTTRPDPPRGRRVATADGATLSLPIAVKNGDYSAHGSERFELYVQTRNGELWKYATTEPVTVAAKSTANIDFDAAEEFRSGGVDLARDGPSHLASQRSRTLRRLGLLRLRADSQRSHAAG
ncbi:MAG TPA: DUF4339 domain-containing protein [Pirellulales bacterium]